MAKLPIVDGRRFGCTACGNCCMQPGFVYITRTELARIASHLEVAPAELRARHNMGYEASLRAWYLDATDGKGCPLLTAERRCSVHPVKPKQCATFPFWPEMLDDAEEWESVKSYCPGLDAPEGQLYDRARITRIRAGTSGT